MAIQKRSSGTGRPSKGDRHVFTTRVPMRDAEKLFAVADSLGKSASEFIAETMSEKLATIDIAAIKGQEELPITRAS